MDILKDIDKFAVEYDEKLENRKYEQEQKSMELSEQWAKNRGKLPKSNSYMRYCTKQSLCKMEWFSCEFRYK